MDPAQLRAKMPAPPSCWKNVSAAFATEGQGGIWEVVQHPSSKKVWEWPLVWSGEHSPMPPRPSRFRMIVSSAVI